MTSPELLLNDVEVDDEKNMENQQKKLSQLFPYHGNTSTEVKVMTMDRQFVKNFEKAVANTYGTLPRPQAHTANGARSPNRAKVHAVGVLSNMLLANQEAHIIDDELKYLQAVESGNLKAVEEILIANYEEEEDQETESDAPSKDDNHISMEGKVEAESANGHNARLLSASSLLPSDKKTRGDKKKSSKPQESVEFTELSRADKQKALPVTSATSTTAGVWHNRGSFRAPLPVTHVKKGNSRRRVLSEDSSGVLPGSLGRKRKRKFNKNCKDQWGRSALFIAMIYHNLDMLKLLLRYEVKNEECLYHAIDFGFYDIVEVFMKHNVDTGLRINDEESFYAPGLTPFQLAAHKNDYVMLQMLHDNGFGILRSPKERGLSVKPSLSFTNGIGNTVLDRAWDTANYQILHYRAISSPAYLIMTFNEGLETNTGDWDFLDSIFRLYGNLKEKVSKEPAAQSLYLPLADQVEDFACNLLNEVRSSSDLANILRFDPPGQPRLTSQRNYLTPVQRAIEVRMKKFVAHENSQLAITSLRLGTLFTSEQGWRTLAIRTLLAAIFPFLCLAFAIAPHSKLGELLCNPIVNMSCHFMSDIIFLFVMITRLILLTNLYQCDCLGTEIYPIDWLIWVWVIARIINQVKKLREVSLKSMLRNAWMLNDMATSLLFVLVIALKIYDVIRYPNISPFMCPKTDLNATDFLERNNISHKQYEHQCTRIDWSEEEVWPITISETALAIIYILIHVRAMEILYTDRTFGPLQLSLDKMMIDTFRFLMIFLVTFIGFSFAMTQLYWSWGKVYSFGSNVTVSPSLFTKCTDDPKGLCHPVYSFLHETILEQYWTLYGYGWGLEPPQATKIPNEDTPGATEISGQVLSMMFHLWAVVVMLNVLVAMLSHSFERVRNNAELEWKFHRSRTWMKFIRKEIYPRPPPMNLVPSTRDIASTFNFLKTRFSCCFRSQPSRRDAQRERNPDHNGSQRENHRYRQALMNITQRYTRRYLLPDFKHDDLEQQPMTLTANKKGSVNDLTNTEC